MDKEEARFRQRFQAFPSSFNLEIEELKSSKKIVLFKKKVEENVSSEIYDSTTERIRMYNLLTFLNWRANENDDAYSYNRKALELDKENIVSLFNRLWMRREDGYLTEANEELNRLAKLAEANTNLLLIGKAEIAYCYPIFGPSYLLKSKDMFEDVVRKLVDKDIHPDSIFSLKLDLGIMYRKLWRDEEECIKRGAELLYEVACSDSPAKWKGRSWASLAEIVHVTSKGVRLNKYRIEELFPKEIKENNIESLLDLAWKACDEDSHTLKVCGKLYRLLYKLDKAEEVLRKSLCKEKTAYAHHQLALVLKQRLKNKLHARRGYNNKARDRYDPVSTNIHHKTFLANDVSQESQGNSVPILNSVREYDVSSQGFSQTNIRTIVSEKKKPISATSEKDARDKSVAEETDINLQYRNTKRTTRRSAKAFDRVSRIPEEEREIVKEILYNLDEAIKFGNEWASLDKGIILRQIQKFKEARDVFLMTLKMECSIKAIIEVSCYENIGACYRDIAEQETDLEQRRKFEIYAVIYWRKALDKIASKEGKTLNFLKEEWMSYPVLKDMFQHRQLDTAMLKELANLGEILERPAETRSFLQELRKLGGNEAKDPTIISCEIKTLLKEYRYDDAGLKLVEIFRFRVYLECAFGLVTLGKTDKVSERFQQAFCVNSIGKSNFDIFLLYEEETETDTTIALVKKLDDSLCETFGLRITSNSSNVDPRKQRWAEQVQQMESSKHIVLIMDTNEVPPGDFQYFIGIAQGITQDNKSILNIILVDDCNCPLELAVFPTMHFESNQLTCKTYLNQWIRDFIYHLLRVDSNDD
ncbi:hypothetical protein ACJMK2_027650 [Sinanodonta woodiana]|uniref:Uncharacterized protein n=1 Tax=Sinanodonta woodiana TaxID=1069815 RepID=A0ABD3X6S8_SINWO